MPDSSLHGNAPDTAKTALLLIDVLNDMAFEGGEALLPSAMAMADRLEALRREARRRGVPVVYVNDNFGRWRSERSDIVAHCLEQGVRGRPVVERLKPGAEDYFVMKPRHSGFYATPLDLLLRHLGADNLVITGITAESCVLFTAADAYVHGYGLVVPEDGVATIDREACAHALAVMRASFKAETPSAAEVDWDRLLADPQAPGG